MFSLIYHVIEAIEGNENLKFAYADKYGNLKFILNRPFNRKYVKQFRSKEDIVNIISTYCDEHAYCQEILTNPWTELVLNPCE